jgi:hypothetical protein
MTMSRSVKKARTKIRKGVAALEKSLDRVKPSTTRAFSGARIAGAAAACVAAVAAVVHYVRGRGRAATLHVRRDGPQWALRTDGTNGSAQTFDTKREAVTAARQEAAAAAPSELVIHRVDGSVEQSHSYELD